MIILEGFIIGYNVLILYIILKYISDLNLYLKLFLIGFFKHIII